jgi:hypothetical protein
MRFWLWGAAVTTDRIKTYASLGAALLFVALVGVAVLVRPFGGSTNNPYASSLPEPAWSATPAPPGFLLFAATSSLAVAASDGNVAYACMPRRLLVTGSSSSPPSASPIAVWSTRDRGRTWQSAADLPSVAFVPARCGVEIDRTTSKTATVTVVAPTVLPHHQLAQTVQLITKDGGNTWSILDIPGSDGVYQLASRSDVTYALYCARLDLVGCSDGLNSYVGVAISRDGTKTWQPITQAIQAQGHALDEFWIGQSTGELYAETLDPTVVLLWHTNDNGAHWITLNSPPTGLSADISATIVTQSHLFLICGIGTSTATAVTPICSDDDGRSWHVRPTFQPLPQATLSPFDGTPTPRHPGEVDLVDLTQSGDLLLEETLTSHDVLYRLALDGSGWQHLGDVPGGQATHAFLAQGSRAGILWALPIVSPYRRTPLDPSGTLFTADYPM